ncbi:hypothetical protein WMY93_010175 [Mugilogobius chulae]|uniref:VPS35 endosomal protein-sorting factor-like n=1 Tax=Mugilogobius chulae TaxID=88201 RepID=A0AAW0PA09_9GOBI
MAAVQWRTRWRKYESELQRCRPEALPIEFGDYHPLKPILVTDTKTRRGVRKGSTSSSSSSSSSVPPDPLSSMLDGTDPLSMFAASASETSTVSRGGSTVDLGKKKKEEEVVGADFEPWSAKRGEILSRFTTTEKLSINLCMGSDKGKATSPASSAVSEKVRTRLEELDDLEEGSQRELLNLSQQDYANRIEELNQSLKEAWASDQKVKALKIVIQCAKLLSDTAVIQFYPSKFVLITDIMDTFGRLVFDRIWSMCSEPQPLSDTFTCDDVHDTAKETCLNWFFKIASIRELLPRLHPSLHVGMEVAPQLKDCLNTNFFDLLGTFRQLSGESVQNQLVIQRVEMPEYLTLFSPAINWILQCIAYRAPECFVAEFRHEAFRPEFVATRATDFIGMIKECDEAGFPKDYINCAEIWVEFTCRHFTKREVNTVLADMIKHMTPDRAFEDAYPQLQSVIGKILTYFHDFSILFSMERFLPFLDMFQKDSVRVEVCRSIMEVFIRHQVEPTRDPVILNAMLHICKTMHDSVNALTLEDEKRSLSLLIIGFIRMTVNQLAMETRRVMRGNHSRKTAAFVRACAAYSFITIPSLSSIFTRLSLYLLSGQVALANQCLSQGPPRAWRAVLVRGLLNMVQDYTWEDNSDAKVLDSNETLYGGDPKFLSEINKLCETLIGQVLDHLKVLGGEEQTARRQGALAFSLFGVLVAHGDLRNNKLSQLAVNLWNLSHKHGYCDTRLSVRTLEYLKQQAHQPDMSHLSDTVQRLALQSRT